LSVWEFNGDFDRPTIRESVLVRSGHYAPDNEGVCWCSYHAEHPDASGFRCVRCHSYVTDGRIEFLPDSSHALAGRTVELPDLGGAHAAP
jgi:hypothetical protein